VLRNVSLTVDVRFHLLDRFHVLSDVSLGAVVWNRRNGLFFFSHRLTNSCTGTADPRSIVRPRLLLQRGLLQGMPIWRVSESKLLHWDGLHRLRGRPIRGFLGCSSVRYVWCGLLLGERRDGLHGLPGWAALGVGLRGVPAVSGWEVPTHLRY